MLKEAAGPVMAFCYLLCVHIHVLELRPHAPGLLSSWKADSRGTKRGSVEEMVGSRLRTGGLPGCFTSWRLNYIITYGRQ